MTPKKTAHSWSDAKAKLAAFDRDGLLGLVQDLYVAVVTFEAVAETKSGSFVTVKVEVRTRQPAAAHARD